MKRIGIVRETKNPPDRRAALDPEQCRRLMDDYPEVEITVQPSNLRCFKDDEYAALGINVAEDLTKCHVLFGVKEVRLDALLPGKTYFFFSHTAKEQPYNRDLLRAVVDKRIRLIDYEYLTREDQRVVAFGRWAGLVGAYNGLRGWGLRTRRYELRSAHDCFDLQELLTQLDKVRLDKERITVTGGGRVAGGALEILDAAGVPHRKPEDFLSHQYPHAVQTRLDPWHYTRRTDGKSFDFEHFISQPEDYESAFDPYGKRTDLFIPCHYWDPRSPVMVTRRHLESGTFPIRLVADISCDIGEPIASTLRASTIAEPFYGYDTSTATETAPFEPNAVTVMAVDNLPGELPRDAATDFGEALLRNVLPELLDDKESAMLARATIADKGSLTPPYAYLEGYLAGRS
ncbi:MAG: NAD(P)-dependent oxidoreductase [Gammaproteobacteria bacterium]|nr:NAD(P)-dependent oxidoreductase [Gammaproteobacteria bacterium]